MKADALIPLAKNLIETKELSQQQYDVWYLTEMEGFTARRIAVQLKMALRTVQREQQRARYILDRAVLQDEEREDGICGMGYYFPRGAHGSAYKEDKTALKAHKVLGFAIEVSDQKAA